MTDYTFSVVVTNSISGRKAGVVMIATPPGKITDTYVCIKFVTGSTKTLHVCIQILTYFYNFKIS